MDIGALGVILLGALCSILTMLSLYLWRELRRSRESREVDRKEILDLRELVAVDPLTGLLNRRAFSRAFGRLTSLLEVTDNKRQSSTPLSSLAVFFIDLDHFKRVNDTFGHAVGDEVLKTVAGVIQRTLRKSDLICRWGGEEIVVALPNVCDTEAEKVAEKIRCAIEDTFFSIPELRVTASIGITCTRDHVPAESLLGHADAAVYQAKAAGRNRVITG